MKYLSAFLFPGQGIQGHDICSYYSFLKKIDKKRTGVYVEIAQDAIDEINPEGKFVVAEMLADETAVAFQQTSFVQPVMYTLSSITYLLFQEKYLKEYTPEYLFGHSLGAFSALTAAGALPFELGTRVVAARSKYMQEACAEADTGLFAILGLPEEKISHICRETGAVIALKNAPTAFVVGARRELFSKIEQAAMQSGARKAFALETSGAFHTTAMQNAYEKFLDFFSAYTLQEPSVFVVMNIGTKASKDPAELKKDVIESIIKPVNWIGMMDFVKQTSVSKYIESGPGTSLISLSRINDIEREQTIHASSLLG
jgi:[acyl-carrier-protein] S-malonyltransferase